MHVSNPLVGLAAADALQRLSAGERPRFVSRGPAQAAANGDGDGCVGGGGCHHSSGVRAVTERCWSTLAEDRPDMDWVLDSLDAEMTMMMMMMHSEV